MGQTVTENGMINHMAADYGYTSDFGVKESGGKSASKNNLYTYNGTGAGTSNGIGSGTGIGVGIGIEASGYKFERSDGVNTMANTIMENFEEYMKDMQEKAKDAGEDDASREKEAKEAAKEMARSLSSEELKKLEMMGIDIDSVRLSDVMGLVNTMRGNAHRAEMQQMMAEISAGNGDMDNVVVSGGTVKAAGTDVALDNVEVSDVVANAAGSDNFKVSNRELIYLLRNNKEVNKENLYKAHYSGSRLEDTEAVVSDEVFSKMLSQIEKVIEQAGYEVDDYSVSGAKLLINNQIPVTTDTIRAYMDFGEFEGKQIEDITIESEVAAADVEAKADMLYQAVKEINPETVYDMAADGRQVTIASVLHYMEQQATGRSADKKYTRKAAEDRDADENNNAWQTVDSDMSENAKNQRAVTAMRQMEEIRLSMTREAAGRLVKLDLNIDTRELSKVVSALRDMEQKMISDSLRNAGLTPSTENIEMYQELSDKVWSVGEASAKILASPLRGTEFTINALYAESVEDSEAAADSQGTGKVQEQNFETVRRSYEAVGTAPRSDMGDSITKAFANVDDILKEMELPVSYENQRAVRILGYNSMELTKENIAAVVDYDRQVNTLLDSFYPEAVLGMIKDGINPLDMPIDELNQVIRDRNYNEGVSDAENFAAFLRDMEKQGEVSESERESYIGIYRAMDKLAKSGDREAGWLFGNGGRLTVRNLVSAMRSRKATGIDVSVDDAFGMLESAEVRGKRIDEQIDSAFKSDTESAEAFLVQNNIELTMINITAASHMINSDGGIYQLVSEILAKLKFKSDTKDNMIDSETENMADSMTGEDIPVEFRPDSILESLRGSDEMSLKYEDLRNRITELMYQSGVTGTISSMDISAIKTVNAGFNILSRMAKDDRYQIPVETEQGIKVMNLTVKHGEDAMGSIEISVNGEQMGMVSAEIRLGASGNLSGYIAASTSEGNYRLAELQSEIAGQINTQGFDGTDITIGKVQVNRSIDSALDESTDTADLYQAAVALVKVIGGVIC